jgi:hypothetical protein
MKEVKRTFLFEKEYIHPHSNTAATVSCEVEVDYDKSTFFVHHGAAHICGGHSASYNLPKMQATADMHIEVLEFIKEQFN